MNYTAADAWDGLKMIVVGFLTLIGFVLTLVTNAVVKSYDYFTNNTKEAMCVAACVAAVAVFVPAIIALAWLIA